MDKRRKIIRIILFLLFMLLFIVSANAADWPRWRGPNGDGISTETDWDPAALAKGPKILWKTNVGFGMSNVSIQGKYLYTLGSDLKNDTVFCLDAETGKEIWKYSYKYASAGLGQLGGYSPQATPTVDEDSVYSLSQAGHLCCLDARKGKVRWYKHLVEDYKVVRPFYGFAGSPVVEGDLLLINGNSYGIALEKKTGKPVWFSPPVDYREKGMNSTGSEYSTPIVYTLNSKRYAAMLSGYGLYSADVATGKTIWFYEWTPADKVADPIFLDKSVFISTAEESEQRSAECVLLDVSAGTPKVLWRNKEMLNHINTSVLIDGYLYGCHGMGGGGSGTLRCMDFKSGSIKWEMDLGRRRPVCVGAAGDKLILLSDRGMLHIAEASPKAYKEISSAQLFDLKNLQFKCWTSPVLCGGRIYCRNSIGDIVCVDVKK